MSVPGSVRGAVAAARASLLVLAGLALLRGPAAADTTTFNGVGAPIVRVAVREGDVTIRTWHRRTVQVDGDPALSIERHVADQSGEAIAVPIQPMRQGGDGPNALSLPPETFVSGSIPAGPRDVVVVHDASDRDPGPLPPTPTVVTIPDDSVYVTVTAWHGNLDVHGYRAGTLVASSGGGRVTLVSVGGVVFAQSRRGPITIRDSSFDLVRARSLFGDITFERCHVHQITATTGAGSIAYDGGSFEPGLASFESERGDIAIGADGPVQFGAHAATDGHVFTDLGRDGGEASTTFNAAQPARDGAPVVTATTRSGNVYLYHGPLPKHRLKGPPPPFRRPGAALPHPFGRPPREFGPRRQAVFAPRFAPRHR
jgi:hypothetical protein